MSNEQFRDYIETLRQQITTLQRKPMTAACGEIAAAVEGLQLIYEEMQTSLEVAEIVEQELLQQHKQLAERYHHYYSLFQSSSIAHLVTDANGMILEANQAIAKLLHIPQNYLVSKPLAVFVVEADRRTFYTKLSQFPQVNAVQRWQISLCPREGEPFVAELNVAALALSAEQHVNSASGSIKALQIGVYNLSPLQQMLTQSIQQLNLQAIHAKETMHSLPPSLDGL